MSKTAMIRARTSPELKEEVESIFNQLGLTTTEAINLFYSQVKLNNGLPFEVKLPSNNLKESIEDIKLEKNLTSYSGKDYLEMMKKKIKK
jgi:DNA-damage-inducible protein J